MQPRQYRNHRARIESLERRTFLSAAGSSVAGTVDPTFGVGGQVAVTLTGAGGDTLTTVRNSAAQPDGKIVVVGAATGPTLGTGATEVAVGRLNADGSPDASFGTNGLALIPAPTAGTNTDYASSVAIDAAGNIVVSATFSTITNGVTTSDQFAVARLLPTGAPDPAFGGAAANGTGVVVANFPAGATAGATTGASTPLAEAHAVAIQADGEIVAAGVAAIDPATGASEVGVARFNTDGTPDATFGAAGLVAASLSGNAEAAYNLSVQEDNKIVVVGTDYPTGAAGATPTASFLVARFNADGSVDSAFGKGGLVTTDFSQRGQPAGISAAAAVGISDDGTIYAGGLNVTTDASGNPGAKFALALYHPNGEPNHPFGKVGHVQTAFGQFASVNHVTILSNDGVVVSGIAASSAQNEAGGNYSSIVAEYTSKGVLNPLFGNKGLVQLQPNSPAATPAAVGAVSAGGAEGTAAATPRARAADVLLSTFGPSAAGRSLVALADGSNTFEQFQKFEKTDAAIALALQNETLLVGSSGGQVTAARLIGDGSDVAVLSVTGLKSSSFLGGSKGAVTVTVANEGDAPLSGPVALDLSLSPAASTTGGDGTVFSTSTSLLKLNPSGRKTIKFTFAFPSTEPAGTFTLTAAAVPGAATTDTVSTDNAASTSPAFTLAPAFVDLGGTFAALPSALTPGGKTSVTLSVQNSGNVPAKGQVTIALLASPDGTAADGTPLNTPKAIGLSLKNGLSKRLKVPVLVPASLPAGNDFLVAVLTAPALNDTNPANNVVVSETMIPVT